MTSTEQGRIVGGSDWFEFMRLGQAFAVENLVSGVAGLFSHSQIFNPVGAGIRVLLRFTTVGSTIAVNLNLRRHDVPLGVVGPIAPFIVENLLGGGPAAVAEIRLATLAVLTGAPFWLFLAPAFEQVSYPPKGLEWAHELRSGEGLVIAGGAVGLSIFNVMQWAEIPG